MFHLFKVGKKVLHLCLRAPLSETMPKPWRQILKRNLFSILIILGIITGTALGFFLKYSKKIWTAREIMYLEFIGHMFIRMLKCLLLPLIVSNLISAIGNLNLKKTGKIGTKAMLYYFSSTVIAVILAVTLMFTLRPGNRSISENSHYISKHLLGVDIILDFIRNLIPPNIIEACLFQYETVLLNPYKENETGSNEIDEVPLEEWTITFVKQPRTNILGIVCICIVLGISFVVMKSKGIPLIIGFTCLADAVVVMTRWVMWLCPVGVISLVAAKIIQTSDFYILICQLTLYVLVILAGLAIHAFVILPVLYFAWTRKQPFPFILNMCPALLIAWQTSSSAEALPSAMKCLIEVNELNPRVVKTVLPIGALINMDGTALYETAAAIFISQINNFQLDAGQIILICIVSIAACLGSTGVPQADLIALIAVLESIGVAGNDATIIIIMDWLIDRFRTAVNILGNSIGAGIIDQRWRKDLESEISLENTTHEIYDSSSSISS